MVLVDCHFSSETARRLQPRDKCENATEDFGATPSGDDIYLEIRKCKVRNEPEVNAYFLADARVPAQSGQLVVIAVPLDDVSANEDRWSGYLQGFQKKYGPLAATATTLNALGNPDGLATTVQCCTDRSGQCSGGFIHVGSWAPVKHEYKIAVLIMDDLVKRALATATAKEQEKAKADRLAGERAVE